MNRLVVPQAMLPVAVPVIVLINIIIFIMWLISDYAVPAPNFMTQNFLVSWTDLLQGRIWILLSAAFSHNMFWHLFMNMYVLDSFGPIVECAIGWRRFINFYFIASLLSSMSHALVSAYLIKKPDLPALGASGAISGIILLFSLMFPKQKILLFGLIPMPAIWGAFLFIGLDAWGLIAQAEGGGLPIGHGAHLGGALTGVIYYFFAVRNTPLNIKIYSETSRI